VKYFTVLLNVRLQTAALLSVFDISLLKWSLHITWVMIWAMSCI